MKKTVPKPKFVNAVECCRNTLCGNYSKCLDAAIKRNANFSCENCDYWKVSGPSDIILFSDEPEILIFPIVPGIDIPQYLVEPYEKEDET